MLLYLHKFELFATPVYKSETTTVRPLATQWWSFHPPSRTHPFAKQCATPRKGENCLCDPSQRRKSTLRPLAMANLAVMATPRKSEVELPQASAHPSQTRALASLHPLANMSESVCDPLLEAAFRHCTSSESRKLERKALNARYPSKPSW